MKNEEKTAGNATDTKHARRAAALKRNMARRKQVRAKPATSSAPPAQEAAREPR